MRIFLLCAVFFATVVAICVIYPVNNECDDGEVVRLGERLHCIPVYVTGEDEVSKTLLCFQDKKTCDLVYEASKSESSEDVRALPCASGEWIEDR